MKQWLVIATLLMAAPAQSADVVHLYAAGSLRDALDEARAAFTQASGIAVEVKYGPSGLLKDEIAAGANADVFASANMDHPQALARAGKSGPVVLFARNRLCALVRPGLAVDQMTLLDRMLDPLRLALTEDAARALIAMQIDPAIQARVEELATAAMKGC